MKKIVLANLLFAISICANAQNKAAQIDARLTGIEVKLQALLTEWKVAGFAVAVVEKNKIIYAKGFGYRDLENKKPVTPNTLFAIGSCSKAFTSSLLGILRNENKISFEERPSKYVADLQFFNTDMNDNIIVKDLMTHRTGLPRHDFSWYLFNTSNRDSLIQRIKYHEPSFGVRKQWQYNNFMFLLQGVIIEKITKNSWEVNIADKIFKPLGMNTSNTTIVELEKSSEPSLGYEVKKDAITKMDYYNINGMAPAGSINSSVNEMTSWMVTWINGGKFNGKEILPASYVSEAISSQMVISGGLPTKEHSDIQFSNYGYGWFLASYKGHFRVEHGGNIDGFSASTCIFPTDSIGIVVLVNQNGSPVPSIVRNLFADRMLKLPQTEWSRELKDARDKRKKDETETTAKATSGQKKGTKPSHVLEEFEGNYSHLGYGQFTLKVNRDSLFAQLGERQWWLKHFHYDIFQPFELDANHKIDSTEKNTIRFNFFTGLTGDIEKVFINDFEPSLAKPLEFGRQADIKEIKEEDLKLYVGEYELGGLVAKVYIKDKKKLFLFVPGQPEYELSYLGNYKFALKTLSGYKIEFEKVTDAIASCNFIQPNGIFKARRKK